MATGNAASKGSVQVTPQVLGAQWAAAQGAGAALLWDWAQSVLRFTVGDPKAKLADIGAACAAACKREKPYSKGWVSRALKAARAFSAKPASPEDAARFMDLFHGVDSKARKAKKTMSVDDALKAAAAFARKAVTLGADPDDVVSAITDALCDGGAADAAQAGSTRKAA
jgi:hypothetical protein